MEINQIHEHFLECDSVSTDTRKIQPNCMFFALKGENFNGNAFAEQALNSGARYCVVDEEQFAKNERCILVDDVLQTLQELASFHRKHLNLPIIALTGSNGKTTTKELIHAVLRKKYNVIATIGNLNNHIGVPLTLLRMEPTTEIGIVEMGANHQKEIEFLCNIAFPNYGLITNFGKAHLEGFGSVDGVIKGKSELYEHLKQHHQLIFVNVSDYLQLRQNEAYEKLFKFGGDVESTLPLALIESQPYLKVKFGKDVITTHLTGSYNFNNLFAAIAIGTYFEVPDEDIKLAIENYVPTNHRSQVIKKGTNSIIMDAYNANPTSMYAALDNFKQLDAENKVMFLGDMFELGSAAAMEHQEIVNYLEDNSIGKAYLVGQNFHFTKTDAWYIQKFEKFDDLKHELNQTSIENSLILIKGSRGMALERVLDLL